MDICMYNDGKKGRKEGRQEGRGRKGKERKGKGREGKGKERMDGMICINMYNCINKYKYVYT